MKTRLLISVIALVIISSLLSCVTDRPPADGTTSGSEISTTTVPSASNETTAPSSSDFILYSAAGSDIELVKTGVSELSAYSETLRTKLRQSSGGINLAAAEYNAPAAQLICGPVDCPEFKYVAKGLGLNEYKIAIYNNKLVIAARTQPALSTAVNALGDYAKQNTKDGALILPLDFELIGISSSSKFPLLSELPALPDFDFAQLRDCGDGFQQAILHGTTASGHSEFAKQIESKGYSLYAQHSIGEISYTTHIKDGISLHSYYLPHSGETRIIASKDTLLPSGTEVTYTKVCEPAFTILGLEKGGDGNGLGAIISLEDGTFIVIDGGHNTNAEIDDIYNTLRSLAADPDNIVIRAWIITHAHADHNGAFIGFSSRYGNSGNFTVESFIYNFCNVSSQRKYGGCSYGTTLSAISRYWSDAKIYKALAGQVYRFAGCDIEILYAFSDFIPQIIGEEKGIPDIDKNSVDGNIETTVFRAYMGGQTVLVTGDTSKVCVDEMIARYGEALKSDIMTVPHHGYDRNSYRARNGSIAFYDLVKPSVAIWPCGEKNYTDRIKYNSGNGNNKNNSYLVSMPQLKENIVAGKETKTIILPYTAK